MSSKQNDCEEKKENYIKIDKSKLLIREMKENEIEEANEIPRIAFYGLLKNPALLEMMVVYARRYANEIYVAEYNNKLIGLGIAMHWGSIRVYGPICVLTKYQKNGIGKMIISKISNSLPIKDKHNKIKRDVLFTHVKTHHIGFYMTIGMLPKYLSWKTKYDINKNYEKLIGSNNNIMKQYG
eukprot:531328_1